MNMKLIRQKGLWHYVAFIVGMLLIMLIITRFKYFYGSTMDWSSQAFSIPEYFRMLFYKTGELFPSFAFNIGAGQNIYNLSYYGFLSPMFFASLLFPFITMRTFVIAFSVISIITSVILIYNWLKEKFSVNIAFYASLCFEFSGALIFQSHRQIMFIIYMPFLILALRGMEKYLVHGKRVQLIISTFLVIMSNYFFSVTAIVVIVFFGIILYIKNNKKAQFKQLILIVSRMVGNILTSIAMSAILWLPTMYVLLLGRKESNVNFSLKELLFPNFNENAILYSHYSLGLTAIFIIAIAYGLISGKAHLRFASIVFMLISFFGIFKLLNCFTY